MYPEDTTTGKTSERHTVRKQVPPGYRADVKVQDGDHSSNWETIYAFDDIPFSQSELNTMRQGWLEQQAYGGFLLSVRNDEDFNQSNLLYPRGGGDSRRFHLEEFKNGDFWTALRYITTAAVDATYQRYSGPPSGHAAQMAGSAELAIDEIHPEFTTRGWGIRNSAAAAMEP